MNATSNCPYNECDGKGISFIFNPKDNSTKGVYCKCRDNLIRENRIKFANIPSEFYDLTLNSFKIEYYSQANQERALRAKQASINFVKNYEEFETLGKGLYFYSLTKGSGKTRLAISIGNALMNTKKVTVKFTSTLDLLSEIKKTYNKDTKYTESQLINDIINVQCLIIDDIGIEKESQWVSEVFYSVLDSRMTKKKVTIFTSNTKIEELKHDERIINRIEKMAIPIYLPDESIRSKISKMENEELAKILFK